MKNLQDFKVGDLVTYKVCASTYTGTVVKVKPSSLVVIGDVSSLILYTAGVALGDEIAADQIIN